MGDVAFVDPFESFAPFHDQNLQVSDIHFDDDGGGGTDPLDFNLDLDNLGSFDLDFDDLFAEPDPHQSSEISSNRTPPDHSAPPSPDSLGATSAASAVADPPISAGAKRKKGQTDPAPNPYPKIHRVEEVTSSVFTPGGTCGDEDDKRKVRLMRNRESAQLSRQRKKHYVEELEEKVKTMQSTIADLNNRISYFMAENAGLRQQLGAKGGAAALPPVYPPPVQYPWMPGYAYRPPPGAVPLVPIPRLKSQTPTPAPKVRKAVSRKGEGKAATTTKKVAGISVLGLMFIMLIFGAVFPVFNASGSVKDGGIVVQPHGRVLSVSGRSKSVNGSDGIGVCDPGFGVKEKQGPDEPGFKQNGSETIPALLYVPRNGKHVKIDGNLIIHSVLASEKAVEEKAVRDNAKRLSGKEGKETSLAIPGSSGLFISQAGREAGRHPKSYKASAEKSTPVEGPLQQWFREGLAGPILNSGMCTEVFQFEVSSSSHPGGIVPASSVVNASENIKKSAPSGKNRNRRILYPQHPIPIAGSILNDTDGRHSANGSFNGNNTPVPSMVVSVLADPREVGDGDVEGMMSSKSLSRVFVVVLLDSVKYVTYSCVLPFKSASPHLVD